MTHGSRFARFLLAALIGAAATIGSAETKERRPNLLVIVADDLGYSDLGAFGGEIRTPNLDKLALNGIRLAGFHTAPTCSPTRSMLLSGTDNHRAGLGTMAEMIRPNQQGKPGYEGYLRSDVATLAERLGANGYRTLLSGKWHLGLTPEQDPHARGFERSFALLQGGHNHFGTDADPEKGGRATYTEQGKRLTRLPADFYSSDTFATRLIEFLGEKPANGKPARPFFGYLAFTAPHWPLQAHPEDIARYKGRYDEGFDVLRERRLARQRELGILAPDVAAHTPRNRDGSWDSLTAGQQRLAARNMEIYAAMVDRLDQNVGRVIETLRASGELDNTVIVFLADNGAEALDVETTGAQMLAAPLKGADNSFANRGTAASYLTYGAGWAQAATAPSWLTKGYQSEGGTRAVAFISGAGIAARKGAETQYLSVADIAPTLLDLAGADAKATRVAGREVVPITGRSWAAWLKNANARVYDAGDGVGAELFGSRAYRRGDWKLTDIGDGVWRLFDIARDPGETRDLSLAHPDQKAELAAAWDRYAQDVGVILPDAIPYRP
ncbi:putative arylsulfatase A [Sphingopyxis sp. LC81]|uniref:arylsulfatase n=1 Tax=Sphingopyxis sp. LC81 TaxID=1502850 RepID=UPI00050F299A|nr:arylsulfatase [Sphingopyxis sp. LC81]KGB55424.1 putative arylsulfatase A [Sphingopyxis sp. LC81]